MAIELADRVATRLFKQNNRTFMETFYSEKRVASEWI
jgi:hypothetical protein